LKDMMERYVGFFFTDAKTILSVVERPKNNHQYFIVPRPNPINEDALKKKFVGKKTPVFDLPC